PLVILQLSLLYYLSSLLSFFIDVYGDHRHLHSFPTRRSSDLTAVESMLAASAAAETVCAPLTTLAPRSSSLTGPCGELRLNGMADRKSTRLNSSHSQISYAVFCLKKKNTQNKDEKADADASIG